MSAEDPPQPIAGARLLFSLDPAVSYLNHGSFGALPITVQRAQQRLRDEMDLNPMRFFGPGLLDRIIHTRRHLAAFLGADPEGSALTSNTTTAVSLVLQSVRLKESDEVLLTDHAYGAVTMAVRRECRRTGATTRTIAVPFGASGPEVLSRVRAALRPGRTRLLIIDQVTSATATLMPVREVVAAARAQGIPVMVDGAHVPGMLPVRVEEIGADFWVGNLHKWGWAPRGTSLLAVSPDWRRRIDPLVVSWEQDQGFPLSVEFQGTIDYTPWLAAPAGIFAMRTLGPEVVREHNAALAAYGQRVVGAALGHAPADLPEPGGPGVSMRIVPLPAGVATTFPEAHALRGHIADKLGVETQINAWGGRGLLRLSAQIYNRPEEYHHLADRLPSLLHHWQW
ncbi:aminotransferase V [Actinoplanes sp. SE50]|uniref:aminotransferase class V-fold PLP-dependent enzyme n=1 Tax=unclassified Actinoplanes TaxID=2626549 RepID=UPI00023EDE32|nr:MULTISPECIES: aminotransferase class V-fold PLP-dependent enzyme [unclassified Actinoplanes]AEV88150.1 aminotransferase class V [Actinoplanes sp. SE50/110]ATO86555.1 aminotransferase V [Actinoplanes sp. SE50]SLM03972.1 aminotransferase V [Actinoplanes sp. SE50/110]